MGPKEYSLLVYGAVLYGRMVITIRDLLPKTRYTPIILACAPEGYEYRTRGLVYHVNYTVLSRVSAARSRVSKSFIDGAGKLSRYMAYSLCEDDFSTRKMSHDDVGSSRPCLSVQTS